MFYIEIVHIILTLYSFSTIICISSTNIIKPLVKIIMTKLNKLDMTTSLLYYKINYKLDTSL